MTTDEVNPQIVADALEAAKANAREEAQSRIAQLEAELAAARKDTERMDWLDKKNPYLWANTYHKETYRMKVDAAMKKPPQSPVKE